MYRDRRKLTEAAWDSVEQHAEMREKHHRMTMIVDKFMQMEMEQRLQSSLGEQGLKR
jgi:hypothetical protein